jgi:cytohesin
MGFVCVGLVQITERRDTEVRMFKAIDSGDTNEVMRLLETDPSLLEGADMSEDGWGAQMTPLIHAAAADQLEIVTLLTGKGADFHATAHFGQTALHFAAALGREEVLIYLLGHGASSNHQDQRSYTPLMLAVGNGHTRVVQLLLEHMGGQGLEAVSDYEGRTALHWAVYGGYEDMVTFLLDHEAWADTTDRHGKSALRSAVDKGHMGVVRLLVAKLGLEALQVRDAGGRSLLHAAFKKGREDLVDYLLRNGLTPSMRDNRGETALMCGARNPSIKVMWRLLGHMGGQGLDERDDDGKTALHWAVCRNQPENVRALLVAGADPTLVDNDGKTPRQWANRGHQHQCEDIFRVSAHLIQIPNNLFSE